ncbi:MAG: hypothetical protein K2H45_03850, partial [Acetatifactor sp.]|nr:hypothetical protein [Acetatifactor sp.]
YNYSSAGDYTYFVTDDSQGMSIGLKPHENFESGYLFASGKAEKKGALTGENISNIIHLEGTVTNDTGYDLAYMAVWCDSDIAIYENVKAGETVTLQQADQRCVYENTSVEDVSDLRYTILYGYGYNAIKEEHRKDDMGALLIGLGVARDAQPLGKDYGVIVGVIRDYDKAVVSKCNETSYGCLYTYTRMEVEQGASN